ncbi:hypothetical protein DENSPDRAFT_832592 [Dentipellis sp. KUC8613]|nr:hypothetical protein DENSPDRAFT_832592 [Dentipellis sp. KUC8613]
MKSMFTSLVATALFVAGALAQTFTVNTPSNAVVCQPLQISWSGGSGPFFLSVLPGADPTGAALEDFGQVNSSPFTWQAVNFPQGTSLGLTLRDSQGNTVQSAPFTVNPGSSTSCLNASGSSSAAGSTSAGASSAASSSSGASSAAPSTTAPASSAAVSTPASSAPASSAPTSSHSSVSSAGSPSGSQTSSSSSPSQSTSGNSSGALSNVAQLGAAGVVGAVVAAVLA